MPQEEIIEHEIYYPAHYWQRRFHESKKRDRGLIAGIRGGKTVGGSNEFLELVTEGEPGVSLMTGPDMPTIKQTIIETIEHGMGPQHLGQWPLDLIEKHNHSDHVYTLKDGNRILYRGADEPDDLRGPAAKAVWCDEVTLCKPGTLEILQGRTLDTGGRAIFTGTPKGKQNWFFQQVLPKCQEVEPGRVWASDRWDVFVYPTAENPGVASDDLADLAAQYTMRMREQELEARFVDWGGAVFDGEVLSACFARGTSHWAMPRPGHPTVVGFDPAGKGSDWSVAVVLCMTCRGVVDIWRAQRLPFAAMYAQIERLMAIWTPDELRVDATSLGGEAIFEELQARVALTSRHTICIDFVFTLKSKVELITYLASRLEEGIAVSLREETAPLAHELRCYEWDDKSLVTDCVMALALAVRSVPPTTCIEPVIASRGLALAPRPRLNRAEMP